MKRSRQELLNSGDLGDVTLTCDGNDIACHRFVLAENSPVFKAMFTTEMTETDEGRVNISDVTFTTLQKVVRFLYTGEINVSGEDLVEILQFSDMYQIDPLRKICGDVMLQNINNNFHLHVML